MYVCFIILKQAYILFFIILCKKCYTRIIIKVELIIWQNFQYGKFKPYLFAIKYKLFMLY